MTTVCVVAFLLVTVAQTEAQRVFATRNGEVSFSAPNDADISAVNNEVTSRIADNGQITFTLLVKGFRFRFAQMQDVFNDQYLESNKYPRADFKGTIANVTDVDFSRDGSYPVTVTGNLTLHGVTKNVTASGTLGISGGKPVARGQFTIALKDFNINGAGVAEKVRLDLACEYR